MVQPSAECYTLQHEDQRQMLPDADVDDKGDAPANHCNRDHHQACSIRTRCHRQDPVAVIPGDRIHANMGITSQAYW